MSAGFQFDPKGQRIPAQGATLGIGWRVCVRDTDGGYGCALKERRSVRAPQRSGAGG
jgi:hypothetical protein